MSALLQRIIGIALIVGSLLGLMFNMAGLFFLPRVEQIAAQNVQDSLQVISGTLSTTAAGLGVVDLSFDNAAGIMDSVETTTRGVSRTVRDTVPLLSTLSTITGRDIPVSVGAVQQSLESAEVGARALDQGLTRLNSLPQALRGPTTYNPATPLHESLGDVAGSFDAIGESFVVMSGSFSVAAENLALMEGDISELADNLSEVDDTITQARMVSSQYQEVIEQQRAVLATVQRDATVAIQWATRVFALLLIWLAIAQVGLLSQGIEMVWRSRQESRPQTDR